MTLGRREEKRSGSAHAFVFLSTKHVMMCYTGNNCSLRDAYLLVMLNIVYSCSPSGCVYVCERQVKTLSLTALQH